MIQSVQCGKRGGPQQVSPKILCRSSDITRPSSPRLMFFTILQTQPPPQMDHKSTTDSITGLQKGHLPHSRHFLLQQLDDITTVKADVICTGHAALHHDSVPARHLEIKQPHNWAFPAHRSATRKFQTRIFLLLPLRATVVTELSQVGWDDPLRQSPICWRSRWLRPSPPGPHRLQPSGQELAKLQAKR